MERGDFTSTKVGEIGIDLVLNKTAFNKQLNSVQNQASSAGTKISSAFKKIGTAVAAAFSVKAIINFGQECIELGSDLAEVQNVVDTTFTSMSEKVNAWAEDAASAYGLSETMAKQYVGLYGSMAEAFGFTESEAYDMSTSLAGLAGDVASFYNIDQDEAYTKLKSVFSGETETLKDLGIVMTQTALDSYALANGYNKTTSAMTEAEKVTLRYNFVQDQLANATGDFTRTQDSWANQTRILSLRFDSLKASLGQAFIQVLTPVIKLLNNVIEKLTEAADQFSNFITAVFGGDTSSASSAASEIAEASSDMDDSTSSVSEDLSDAADTSEEIKNNLAGFDKLNVLDTDNSSSSSSSSTSADSNTATSQVDVDTSSAEKASNNLLNKFKKAFKNFYEKSGFKDFVGKIQKGIDSVNWSKIQDNCKSIFNDLKPIATTAFSGLQKVGKSAFKAFGSYIGGIVSVTGKSVQTVTGGVAKWLSQDKTKIQGFITTICDNYSTAFENLSDYWDGFFGVMGKSIDRMRPIMETSIADMLSGFTTFAGSLGTVISSAYALATQSAKEWITEDAGEIGLFFDNLQLQIASVMDFIGGIFGDIGDILLGWWDGEGGSQIFKNVCDMFMNIGTTLMNVWNDWIMPVWEFIVGVVQSAWDNTLKPVFDKLLSFFGKVADCISSLWNTWLSPIVNFFVDTFGPIIKSVLTAVKGVFDTVFTVLGDVIGGLLDALGGLIDFITGVFTGDWKKAWNGIKSFFKGIWDAIWGIIKGIINLIIDAINLLWTGIYTVVKGIVNAIGGIAGAIGSIFGQDWSFSMPDDVPLIPKLASGGMVTAPTLAVVGDNSGASTGDPEVVSPLSKLQGMINDSSGEDVVILTQILDYLKRIYEMLVAFKNNGGNVYEFIAELNGSNIFKETIKQDKLYRKRHGGKSAFST